MDWELYERYRATLYLVVLALVSFLLLAFQRTSVVRTLRSWLVYSTLPPERYLSQMRAASDSQASQGTDRLPSPVPLAPIILEAEESRALQVLHQENERLKDLLALQKRRWPAGVAAHVVGRDPQRWFQEIILDKGKADGLRVDSPVVALVNGREGLVGRVIEVAERVAKVMLIQDSLSAVAVTVEGSQSEDGIVEGSNGHDLLLKFLDRSSVVKIGDRVVTSGLGRAFPEGIPVGWVEDIQLDPRQLFLQARLRPSVQSNQVHWVLVLLHGE